MMLKRAEAAGCPVVAVTVDLPGGRNTETDRRLARTDTRHLRELPRRRGTRRQRPRGRRLAMVGCGTKTLSASNAKSLIDTRSSSAHG